MRLGSILLVVGVVALLLYFVLFYRTFRSAGNDAERYLEVFGSSKRRNLVAMFLIIAAFLIPIPSVAILLMALGIGWTAKETVVQHSRMRELGFGVRFERRLAWTSVISPLAILCLFGSKLWFQANVA